MSWRWVLLVPLAVAACGGDDDGGATTTVGPAVASVEPSSSGGRAPSEVGTTVGVATTVAPPTTGPPPTTVSTGVAPEGFVARGGVITAADGTVCEVCLWVAATSQERARGLMGVTDLGGADGMVFLWDVPDQGDFWMRDTPMPLSIAFFAADGAFVSSADMVPCLDGPDSSCARYGALAPYVAAIEVPSGGLGAIGIAAGSHLELLATFCQPTPTSL